MAEHAWTAGAARTESAVPRPPARRRCGPAVSVSAAAGLSGGHPVVRPAARAGAPGRDVTDAVLSLAGPRSRRIGKTVRAARAGRRDVPGAGGKPSVTSAPEPARGMRNAR
ncbi:hypothetical protein [Streptomyces rubradiris]|uniref:Uncharacterized protein n=1 Tax=Streptomyces rubradiris TaxID=285531 RepID=A0ABQ3RR18_STRRR|nr:hypothetical protein [Streptomyces rubradiris]GHH24583.1 hypothetical protein GCM10018792_62310 [Streptomyces rubradiris]GHI58289.1 hypothetical protein Srubr_81350 [Streptomyces rubradiris]